ncbi:MAG: hypothetical protein FWD71_14575 [Oscillospiraceae bacterium]|nr:hypothetical protein [Oscillospiraceae bacterium]
MKMNINGKNFKELTLWQKILVIIAVPAVLLTTFVILFVALGAAFAGIAGLLAIIFSAVLVIIIIAVIVAMPIAIFKKIKRGLTKNGK